MAANHLAAAVGHHTQHLKKHRMDNGDYYENGHLGKFTFFILMLESSSKHLRLSNHILKLSLCLSVANYLRSNYRMDRAEILRFGPHLK